MRYAPRGETYFIEGVLTTARAQRRLSPIDLLDTQVVPPNGTPGASSVTLRGGAELLTNVRGTVAIENVFDRDYRVHGSGLNETGTSVVFGIEVKM
jgi:hemoglobin/transferrin/lactoferrin receptor protein